jgi:hypothetical protein
LDRLRLLEWASLPRCRRGCSPRWLRRLIDVAQTAEHDLGRAEAQHERFREEFGLAGLVDPS